MRSEVSADDVPWRWSRYAFANHPEPDEPANADADEDDLKAACARVRARVRAGARLPRALVAVAVRKRARRRRALIDEAARPLAVLLRHRHARDPNLSFPRAAVARGEPGPGADVGGGSPVLGRMWEGEPGPGADVGPVLGKSARGAAMGDAPP